MSAHRKSFHGKIMLVGEYEVLHGSKALALPWRKVSGHWTEKSKADIDWEDFITHCKNQILVNGLGISLVVERIEELRSGKWVYASDIPIGQGLGSSGALCASFFDRFCQANSLLTIEEIRSILSAFEDFFHGKSSGLDPLVSYFDQAILIHENGEAELVSRIDIDILGAMELYHSGVSRITADLVLEYMKRYNSSGSFRNFSHQIIRHNEFMIQALLSGNKETFVENLSQLSELQLDHWDFLIPSEVKHLWKEGLHNKRYFKLCGAGGGGCFLIWDTENLFQI